MKISHFIVSLAVVTSCNLSYAACDGVSTWTLGMTAIDIKSYVDNYQRFHESQTEENQQKLEAVAISLRKNLLNLKVQAKNNNCPEDVDKAGYITDAVPYLLPIVENTRALSMTTVRALALWKNYMGK